MGNVLSQQTTLQDLSFSFKKASSTSFDFIRSLHASTEYFPYHKNQITLYQVFMGD